MYLLSTTQLIELLKIPLLIQHYVEHKQHNNALSIIVFLEIHYAHGSPKDADYDKDMKLPFKSITSCNSPNLTFCSIFSNFKLNPVFYFYKKKNHFFAYSFNHYSSFTSSIWQPPKSC